MFWLFAIISALILGFLGTVVINSLHVIAYQQHLSDSQLISFIIFLSTGVFTFLGAIKYAIKDSNGPS